MIDIFNVVLNRIHSHVLPKTKDLRVTNEYTFEEEVTPFEYGYRIETYFLFHIYLRNFSLAINRFDTRTKCINNELFKINATVNGIPLSKRKDVKFDPDMRFPYSYNELLGNKKIAANWLFPLWSAIREMQLLKKDINILLVDFDTLLNDGLFEKILREHYDSINYDKKLGWHFLLTNYKFVGKRRCLLKPKFIATFPDVIIDDTIIDIKTNTGFTDLKDQCAQLLHQFIDFYAFRNFSNVVYNNDTISDYDRKKILLPVRKICLYYYRYNKFFTIDLKKLLSEEEFNQLIAVKKDYSRIMF